MFEQKYLLHVQANSIDKMDLFNYFLDANSKPKATQNDKQFGF